ncbi:MAG: tRNA uridine-5-carboxymethylaminomethyl(34) synthesis enzyme MnmG [Phycisphaerae bacterium]
MRFDVVIIGGGHAGAEAAWAAARLGAETAMITMERDAIGRMSCNPAIGGLGKGQMVREIDALGGIMGLATDRAGIQFRTLNRSKGPAVWAPRAQCDRDLYASAVQDLLHETPRLTILEGLVDDVLTTEAAGAEPRKRVTGVRLKDGREVAADAVIVTTGTFLRALMHCGLEKTEGGRVGEQAARGMSASLAGLGFELLRLKTGTPPRIHRDSVDYDQCEEQPGDDPAEPFSFQTDGLHQEMRCCWITWTTPEVHALITDNLHQAPMYSGQIDSTGPRYCPSIEDKVVRFADKPRHQVFLEPEGYDNERIYCNGISTSLPADVQADFIRRIPGLERAEILQAGYAVEYDAIPTHQIESTLQTKLVAGLYLAGQINGTSGYEEAAAQGLVAGINAVQAIRNRDPFLLRRDQAYIGVMIDDLITSPPQEPYRMFTSRAEYRLMLRSDNADQRLTPVGRDLGLVDDNRWGRFVQKREALHNLGALTRQVRAEGQTVESWLKRPDANVDDLSSLLAGSAGAPFCVSDLQQLLIDAKYAGYVDRQNRQVEKLKRLESVALPANIDYSSIQELRLEAREKLAAITPRTLGQAGRISGINPADVTVLWVYLSSKRLPQNH